LICLKDRRFEVPMATRREANIVYAAGLVQGIVLVTFPAASTVFTDPSEYDLSNTQYGTMFLPQVLTAVTAALLGGNLARRLGAKRVYLTGLVANLTSMVLLVLSQFFTSDQPVAYGLLLGATACLGVGFGLTTPTLNTLTAVFHPAAVDRSVLVLNALLGLGTALAPVFVAIFVGLGFWWGLPVLSAVLLALLLAVSLPMPLHAGARSAGQGRSRSGIPSRFWLFAGFAVLYGICETMNGNWAQLDMTGQLGGSATQASIALTTFWAMVTAGRLLFALVQKRFPTRDTYRLLPFLLAAALAAVAVLPDDTPALGVLAFGLAGLGCSALLPLTVSFGQQQLAAVSASVAGGVIAFYQIGYGIAAFGAGPLQDAGVGLPAIFGFAAVAAVAMGGLSIVLTTQRHRPRLIQKQAQGGRTR
jgi:fucose permease